MKLEQGQHVKCFMRSTMVLEGLVEEWTDAQVVLKSLDGQSLMIIHSPGADIMITKVVLEEPAQEIAEEPQQTERKTPQEWLDEQPQDYIKKKLAEVMDPNGELYLDKMNIAQLRQLVHEQEKEMITQKKKEHFGTPNAPKRSVPYSNPWGQSAYYQRPRKKQ